MFASRARRVGLVAVLGGVAAAAAFLALGSSGGTGSPDAYTVAANRFCRAAERRVEQVKRRHRNVDSPREISSLAQSMYPIAGALHRQLEELSAPADRIAEAVEFEGDVYQLEADIIDLAQLEPPTESRVRTSAEQTERTAAEVKRLAVSLGLDRCAQLTLGISPGPS